jgi:hypothetical protein
MLKELCGRANCQKRRKNELLNIYNTTYTSDIINKTNPTAV